MRLAWDRRDEGPAERRGDRRLYWLDDLGGAPLDELPPGEDAFLFAGARPPDDYARLVAARPGVRDRPEERAPLLALDTVLDALAGVSLPAPRTWRLELDAPLPPDLTYPLFLRTPATSWKLGGQISRVRSERELGEECQALRRAFGWDVPILARDWLDLAAAGESANGPVPQEVRTWIVDGVPVAWSFHHLHVVPRPRLAMTEDDLALLRALATDVGRAFRSRLVAADFARDTSGLWWFVEAGPGSCAGTAHQAVFGHVARRLLGECPTLAPDEVGGPL